LKDNVAALEALGFSLPSTAYLIGVVVFAIVGYVAYRYGKKMSLPTTKWIGIALMLYPYAVTATWLLYVVGAGLCVWAYWSARR
jgi:Sodium:neurotransmitter symporter family